MILLYNTNATRNPNAYLTLAIEDALHRLLGPGLVKRVDERRLAAEAASGNHEILLCIDGQRVNGGLLAHVKAAFRMVVLWAFEDPFMLEYNLGHRDLFDWIFTNDPSCVGAYGGRASFLPLAASRMLHHRDVLADEKLRCDIFFAGTMWPNRTPVLRRLIEAFPHARLKLVCPTNEYLPPLPPQIAERAIMRPISHPAFIDFANSSRVTLTLFRDYASHVSALSGSGLATAPGPRLYELGMAGAAQVVHHDERMEASHFDAVDGVVRASGDTLVERIAEILADPSRREILARDAQASVLAAHGYEHRLSVLLERCGLPLAAAPSYGATLAETKPAARPIKRAAQPAATRVRSGRIRVLMCTHSTIHNQVWGGVEVYQQMLCTTLARDVEALTWIRRDGACQLLDAQGRLLERFDGEDIGWLDVLSDAFEERHFSNMLASYQIDLVHFQHLGHHAASLPLIAKACGVGTLLSVHDFFLVCARYNLLDYEQKYCDIGNRPISACTICLAVAEGLPPGVQQQRRGFIEQVLRGIDLLLFGSRQSEELVMRIYPQTTAMRRLVMGIPAPTNSLPRMRVDASGDDAGNGLEVMIVGNFLRTKGADTVLRVIGSARPDLFRFHILGMAEPHYLSALDTLVKEGKRVVYHGRYAPGELSLSKGHVALHLSIWPETWCISLSEVWEAGLIPIVTDIGALGERVTHGIDGFKVAVGDAGAVLDHLEILRANPNLRKRLAAGIGPHLWAGSEGYSSRLLEEYRALVPKSALGGTAGRPLSLELAQLHLLPKRSWKQPDASRHILDALPETGLKLDLPQSIVAWSSIQQCRLHVDTICGIENDPLLKIESGTRHKVAEFEPADRFQIDGWVFQPGAYQAGQVFVCLMHQTGRHVLFVAGERLPRADVQARHAEAPLRSGFAASLQVAGKWSDGSYAIGLIMVTNGQASFHLTGDEVAFLDGKIVSHERLSPEDRDVLRAFACVFASSPMSDRFMAARRQSVPATPATIHPGETRPQKRGRVTAVRQAPPARRQKPFADGPQIV